MMAPKKRKVAAHTADTAPEHSVEPNVVAVLSRRLKDIDAAVEERCEAIKAAADDAVAKIMQQLKLQLLQLPKKERTMPYKEYMALQQQNSHAVSDAAAALVESKLSAAQQQSVAAATTAPTTRSLRSRARSATAAAAVEPRTTRSTRSRQAVPAAGPQEEAPSQVQKTVDKAPAGHAQLQTLMGIDSPSQPAAAAAAAQPATAPSADAEARRAAALDRAQAKVDAKLAALGMAAAGTAARAAAKTVQRAARPGEACFSKNGSPLSIHPNITRNRGRTIATSLMTPALQAAPAGTSMVGCITLIKKQPAAAGAAAATGRGKRNRAAAAAAAAEEQAAGGDDGTAMMVTTDDGNSFTVDAAAGGIEAVPSAYQEEVAAKLRAIQQLATAALGIRA